MTTPTLLRSFSYLSPYRVELIAEGFKEEDIAKLQLAINHIAVVLSSKALEDFIIHFSYEIILCSGFFWWKRHRLVKFYEFRLNNGKSQRQIYDDLTSSQTVNIFLKLDNKNRKDIAGYTYPSTKWQWIYKDFFSKSDYKSVAGNLIHEWVHKLGYDHDSFTDPLVKYTVPYAVGNYFKNS